MLLAIDSVQPYPLSDSQINALAYVPTATKDTSGAVESHLDRAIVIKSSEAEIVSLDYGARNSLSDPLPTADFYFDHAAREVALINSELRDLPISLTVSNAHVFQVAPYINEEGKLIFKPSGKPGLNAVSAIRVTFGASEVQKLTITVENDGNQSWALTPNRDENNLATLGQPAEGEGPIDPYQGSSSGGANGSSGSYSNSGSSSGSQNGSSSNSGGGSSSEGGNDDGSSGSYHCGGIGYLLPYADDGSLLSITEIGGGGDQYGGEFACGHTQYTVGSRFFIGAQNALGGTKYVQEWDLQPTNSSNQSDVYVYPPDEGTLNFSIPQPLGLNRRVEQSRETNAN
jgi:hypothetical protein